jgi:hypothetical protein
MILYALQCDSNHDFESWFKSAEAFDSLLAAGLVECSLCGSTKVHKKLMAPALRPAREATDPPLGQPRSPLEEALANLRRQVEENSEYVGMNFATEARAIHDGDAPERAIHGEARAEEARALMEDGINVTPLPFMPSRKTN